MLHMPPSRLNCRLIRSSAQIEFRHFAWEVARRARHVRRPANWPGTGKVNVVFCHIATSVAHSPRPGYSHTPAFVPPLPVKGPSRQSPDAQWRGRSDAKPDSVHSAQNRSGKQAYTSMTCAIPIFALRNLLRPPKGDRAGREHKPNQQSDRRIRALVTRALARRAKPVTKRQGGRPSNTALRSLWLSKRQAHALQADAVQVDAVQAQFCRPSSCFRQCCAKCLATF